MTESTNPTATTRTYLPAAGRDAFLPFYDLMTKLMGADRERRFLLQLLSLKPGEQVLDIGCGTGTLVVAMKLAQPAAHIIGLDPDPKALARAAQKAQRAKAAVYFQQGFADEMPFQPASFDTVVSSFMFHHLETGKLETLRNVRRVLKSGGSFYLLDFETAHSGHHVVSRIMHSHQRTADNSPDRIVGLMKEAGFAAAARIAQRSAILGFSTVGYYHAVAP